MSPPSLKSFFFYLSLYEENMMEELTTGAFSSLEDLFGGEVVHKAWR